MKYFINCKSKEEAKAEYRKLAKKMHPDGGGDGKDMIELQKQYESFEANDDWRKEMFGNSGASENAFRESVYDKYRQQQADSPYFRTYTFNAQTSNNSGELQRLRDENTKLRSQLYQYESQMRSLENTKTFISNQNHILEMENKALKTHGRHITKEMDEIQAHNNELISTYPKTAWATIKHLFKLLSRPYDEYA